MSEVSADKREVIVFFVDIDKSMRKTDLSFSAPTVIKDRFEVFRQALKSFVMLKTCITAHTGSLWFSLCGIWGEVMELLPISPASSGEIDFAIDQFLVKQIQLEYTHDNPVSISAICDFLEDTQDRFLASNPPTTRFTAVRGILFCSRDVPFAPADSSAGENRRSRHEHKNSKVFLDVIPLWASRGVGHAAPTNAQTTAEKAEDDFEALFETDTSARSLSRRLHSSIVENTDEATSKASEEIALVCAQRAIRCAVVDMLKVTAIGAAQPLGQALGCALALIFSTKHHYPNHRLDLPKKMSMFKPDVAAAPPSISPRNLSPRQQRQHADPVHSVQQLHEVVGATTPPPHATVQSAVVVPGESVIGRVVFEGDSVMPVGVVRRRHAGADPSTTTTSSAQRDGVVHDGVVHSAQSANLMPIMPAPSSAVGAADVVSLFQFDDAAKPDGAAEPN